MVRLRGLGLCFAAFAGFRSQLHVAAGAARRSPMTCSPQDQRFREGFNIITREQGSVRKDLPIFTNKPGLVQFKDRGLDGVVLHNVFSDEECDQLIAASEAMGYTEDAP
eukprot:symbB.v1.2.003942.t1/scaffold210.1/size302740/33